jgi:hypothetical protein
MDISMNEFTSINYGNDWGIFVDIENDECKYSNSQYVISINGYNDKKFEDCDNYDKKAITINNIFIDLFIFGLLFYTINFVL